MRLPRPIYRNEMILVQTLVQQAPGGITSAMPDSLREVTLSVGRQFGGLRSLSLEK